ncbi:hypothetical protein H9Q70_007385 [Fusarium xylarioides]|nr:hypothetical protein H9Q70_007385 [Fusarium xylarioides]KAG5778708.1 hypothetical protein H9Q73_007653 [Fusarium xylarioides]
MTSSRSPSPQAARKTTGGKQPRKSVAGKQPRKSVASKAPRKSTRKAQVPKGKSRPKGPIATFNCWMKDYRTQILKSNKPTIAHAPFVRLIREIMFDITGDRATAPTRVTPDAIGAFKEATEAFAHQLFEGTNLLSAHAGRKTIQKKDMQMYYRVQRTMANPMNDCLQRMIDPNTIKSLPFFGTKENQAAWRARDQAESREIRAHERDERIKARAHAAEDAKIQKRRQDRQKKSKTRVNLEDLAAGLENALDELNEDEAVSDQEMQDGGEDEIN